MNIFFLTLIIFVIVYILLNWFVKTSSKKISKGIRLITIILSIVLAIIMAYAGRFNFNNPNQNFNTQSISTDEAYRILNLDPQKKYTKEEVTTSYKKIMKKIHPDVSPELSRLASIVNEAKEVVLKNIS